MSAMRFTTFFVQIFVWFGVVLFVVTCSGQMTHSNPFDAANSDSATNAMYAIYPGATYNSTEQKLSTISGGVGAINVSKEGITAVTRIQQGSTPLWHVYHVDALAGKINRYQYSGTNAVAAGAIATQVSYNFLEILNTEIVVATVPSPVTIQKYFTNNLAVSGGAITFTAPSVLGGGSLQSATGLTLDSDGNFFILSKSSPVYLIKYGPSGGVPQWQTEVGNAFSVSLHRTGSQVAVLLDADSLAPKVALYEAGNGQYSKQYKNIANVLFASMGKVKYFKPYEFAGGMRKVGSYLWFFCGQATSGSTQGSVIAFYRWLDGPFSEPVTLWPIPESMRSCSMTPEEDILVGYEANSTSSMSGPSGFNMILYTKRK